MDEQTRELVARFTAAHPPGLIITPDQVQAWLDSERAALVAAADTPVPDDPSDLDR